MKNKTIFKSFCFLFLIFFGTKAFCESPKINFSFTPEFGLFYGKIVENVWFVNVTKTDKLITYTPTTRESRLDWKLQNTVFSGGTFEFFLNDRLNFSLGVRNCFPQICGTMEDYDWLNTVTKGWENDPADELTNYSIHINTLNMFYQVDFSVGCIFYLTQNKSISIMPRLGMQFQGVDFTGSEGWYTYKKYNWEKLYFHGDVISYSQTYSAPSFGLKADFNFATHFEFSLDFLFEWIKQMNCIDKHLRRNDLFNDRIQDIWKTDAKPCFFYKINDNHKIGLKTNFSYFPDRYGFTYDSETETVPDFGNPPAIGGTSRFLWGYSLVYCLHF